MRRPQQIRWQCQATGADVVGGHRTSAVMLAVLAGNVTIGELTEATGYGKSCVNKALHDLRELGLVDFVGFQHGTLHPTVRMVG